MRTMRRVITVVAGVSLALTGSAAAVADDESPAAPEVTAGEIQIVRDFLVAYDVPETQQDQLIDKILAGEVTDADSETATPLTVEVASGETVSRFADGSVRVESIEHPVEVTGPAGRGIGGCTIKSGSGYRNASGCKIDYVTPIFNFHFYADFTLVQGGPDSITRAYGGQVVYAVGHEVKSTSTTIPRKTESGSNAALAQYGVVFQTFKLVTVSKGVNLNVGKDTYW
jgi:hypothetical protein